MRGTTMAEDKSHVKALRYSLYNAATLIIAGTICGALVSVYFVLEAFIQPLVWAMLIGCFLFPIKRSFTQAGQLWLREIREDGKPFSLGLLWLPFKMVDFLAEQLWTHFFAHWRMLLTFLIVGGICYFLSTIELLYPVTFTWNFGCFLYSALGMFRAEWVWTCALMYLIVVVFFKDPYQSRCPWVPLQNLAVFIWISLIFHLSTWLGILRLPVGVGLVVAFFVGSWNSLKTRIFPDEVSVDEEDGGGGDVIVEEEDEAEDGDGPQEQSGDGNRTPETIGPQPASTTDKREKYRFCGRSKTEYRRRRQTTPTRPSLPRSRSFSIVDALDSIREMTPFADFVARRHHRHDHLLDAEASDAFFRNALNRLFLWLGLACIIVYIFNHPAILQLLPLPTLFIITKRGLTWLWRRYKPLSYIDETTKELIIPKPICALWSVVCKGDQKILVLIESTISKVATVVLLCLLIIVTTVISLMIIAQVQRESVQLMWTSANLINETVSRNPEIAKWLPQSDSMQSTITSVIEKGYEHGREWLAKKVSSLVTGNGEDNKEKLKVEKELLEVIDDLYRSWHTNQSEASGGIAQLCKLGLTSCPSVFAAAVKSQEKVEAAASAGGLKDSAAQTEAESRTAQMWRFVDNMMKMSELKDILDVNRIMEIMRDNIGSVMAILESLLVIVRTNVNSVFNFVTAMISLLFGGGTVLLNFVVSTIVFLTALFYLLSISEKVYKPISWITAFSGSIIPMGDFEAAISSVMMATLKMAVFYGLYTWLTHSIFAVNIVFIPAVLAAVFAAVPFIGTYWAAVPAMVELWILKNDLLRAILLLIAHLAPTYFIDMLIYGDIKDGGHPYLTGLAIVGGIYFLGLQGAIIGPILLCCLIVVFNVYQRMLASESSSTESAAAAHAAAAHAAAEVSHHNSSHLHRFDHRNPGLYLHRSTPTDAASSPANVGCGVTGASSSPSAVAGLVSPATPNSVFRTNSRSILRKAAVIGSRRLHRSTSLPNVDDPDA